MSGRRAGAARPSRTAEVLRQAGLRPRSMEETGPPVGFELGPLVPGGAEAVAFEEARGLTLGLKLPLAPPCELLGLAPTAERALKLLGAMMLGLQAQGMQVSALARYRGLEGLLLWLHLCPPLRARAVSEGFERLGRTAHALGKALAEPPDRILVALRQAAGVRGMLAVGARRLAAKAVPAFDAQRPRRRARRD